MKVLFVTRKYPPQVGGMENFSYHTTQGIDCEKKILALGKRQYHLLWFFPYALLYTLVNAHKYDVIHFGDFVLCLIGHMVKWFYPKKAVVIQVHGLDVTFKNPIYQRYIRLFGGGMNRYVCDSRYTAEMVEKLNYGPRQVILVGIDTEKFASVSIDKEAFKEDFLIPKENRVMITVGRLVKRKGVAWFLQNVMPELKNESLTYLIVGVGPDEQSIDRLIKEQGLSDKVRLLGRVDESVLQRIYRNADIFVMPNIKVEGDMEGFGIVAIEASLAGLVLVASEIEGIKDAVEDGKNGILLTHEEPEGYKKQLKDIIKNYDKYEAFAKDASEYTKHRYSWENICSEHKQVFEDVLSDQGAKQ